MRINYICLKGFKRFRLANIQHFEAEFPEAITVIIAESGKGKSSLLAQLNPLPAVRTDFEKDGYKEIRITHENHEYKLISAIKLRLIHLSAMRLNLIKDTLLMYKWN